MGFFNIFKKSKRQQIRDNADQGREGEAQVRSKYEMNGYDVKRTGRGSDYRVTKRNWLTGKKVTKYVEINFFILLNIPRSFLNVSLLLLAHKPLVLHTK